MTNRQWPPADTVQANSIFTACLLSMSAAVLTKRCVWCNRQIGLPAPDAGPV